MNREVRDIKGLRQSAWRSTGFACNGMQTSNLVDRLAC